METRIWCEFTPPEEVCRDYIIDAFKRYNVTLNYKLEYGHDSEDFYNMVRTYNDHHVPLSIWATLSDEMGYWINERNAEQFDRYVRKLAERFEYKGLKIKGLCIDLESPLQDIKSLCEPKSIISLLITCGKMLTANLNRKRFTEAGRILSETARFLRSKGLESYAACIRHCYYDIRFKSELIQNALEIPVFDVGWDKYNLMYYSTIIRNELRKIRKADVDYLMYHQISYLKEVLKDKLAVSIGVTNVGKMGNEPYYENISEFEKDIGILKEIGINSFSLFSLDGIIEKNKLLGYLAAMERAKPYKPAICSRVIRNEEISELLFGIGKLYYRLR